MIETNVFCMSLLAEDRVKKHGQTPQSTDLFLREDSRAVGLTGALAVAKIMGIDVFKYVTSINLYRDGGMDFQYHGKKVDVKTQLSVVKPDAHYRCNIAEHQKDYPCTHYVFCFLIRIEPILYIAGACSKQDFFKNARFNKKGDTMINGFTYTNPVYDMPISELDGLSILLY